MRNIPKYTCRRLAVLAMRQAKTGVLNGDSRIASLNPVQVYVD
jgi:hypothetical protein